MNKPRAVICDIEGCLANDSHRRHFVDPHYLKENWSIENDYESKADKEGNLPVIVVKQDGTVWKKNFEAFNEAMVNDTPNLWFRDLLTSLNCGFCNCPSIYNYCDEFIFVTERQEKYRDITSMQIENWALPKGHFQLFMRPTDDFRPDIEIKREIYEQHIRDKYEVLFCVDDNASCCTMYRQLGLTVLNIWQE